MGKMFDCEKEKKIQAIIKVLWEYEGFISDGYSFYTCGETVEESIREVAEEIFNKLTEK